MNKELIKNIRKAVKESTKELGITKSDIISRENTEKIFKILGFSFVGETKSLFSYKKDYTMVALGKDKIEIAALIEAFELAEIPKEKYLDLIKKFK